MSLVYPAIKWYWQFGDGGYSFDQNPEHIYLAAGKYTVSLTVTDKAGNTEVLYTTIRVFDFDYENADIPVGSKTSKCYRLPVKNTDGFGVSEYGDSENTGLDWIWPSCYAGCQKGYDSQRNEIILVTDAKMQREYRINDEDVWKDRTGAYGGNTIRSELHQKAHYSAEGEHIPIRHVEHHEYFKSFDRLNLQSVSGFDSVGLPTGFRVNNQLFQDGEPFTPVAETKRIPLNGDLVFQEKVEGRNLQLRTIIYGAPYYLTGIMPYYETVDRQASPELRKMSEDTYQKNIAGTPYIHISRCYNPLLNLAKGTTALGTYATVVTGPDGKARSGVSFGVGDLAYDTTPDAASVSGNWTMYCWIANIPIAVTPIQIFAGASISIEIHSAAGVYQLLINHNGEVFTEDINFNGVAWTLITVSRSGLNLRAYENKSLIGLFTVATAPAIGNTLYFAPAGQMTLFDMCMVPAVLSADEVEYYYDNVIRGGGEVLRRF